MERDFWSERWTTGQIGFHQPRAHDMLVAHHEAGLRGRQRVYVPLCGKSVDLLWLRDHGHDVVGSEFVGHAVDAFFTEHFPDLQRLQARYPTVTIHETSGVRVIEGDACAVDTFATGGLRSGGTSCGREHSAEGAREQRLSERSSATMREPL